MKKVLCLLVSLVLVLGLNVASAAPYYTVDEISELFSFVFYPAPISYQYLETHLDMHSEQPLREYVVSSGTRITVRAVGDWSDRAPTQIRVTEATTASTGYWTGWFPRGFLLWDSEQGGYWSVDAPMSWQDDRAEFAIDLVYGSSWNHNLGIALSGFTPIENVFYVECWGDGLWRSFLIRVVDDGEPPAESPQEETPIPPTWDSGISITLNGTPISFDVPPMIVNDRTMVPFRAIFEAFGMEVNWDEEHRMAGGWNEETRLGITLTIDSHRAVVSCAYTNEFEVITLDVPPMIYGGRTLVPVRFIAEATGANVEWDGDTQTVIITTN